MESRATRAGVRRRVRRTWEPINQAQWLCSYWLKRAERQVSSKLASRLKMWGIIGSEWAAIRDVSARSHIFRRPCAGAWDEQGRCFKGDRSAGEERPCEPKGGRTRPPLPPSQTHETG
jgi:hypothetical protein